MRKLILAGAALLALGTALPAYADDAAQKTTGAAVGATTGGTIGFLVGGPIGAIIGGFSGAVIGGGATDAAISYAGNHPVDQVYIDGNIDVGYRVGTEVHVYPIEGDDAHGYFYANNRVWIVDSASGEVVASPGYVVPDTAVSYVKAHRTNSIEVTGDVGPGYVFDGDVTFTDVPDSHGYGYVYIGDRPALVDTHSRAVIWIE